MTDPAPPLTSYDPDLIALWDAGTRRELRWSALDAGPRDSPAFADRMSTFFRLRLRLHKLRKRLSRDNDPRAAKFYKAEVVFRNHPSHTDYGTLIIRPRDLSFSPLLREAGIQQPSIDDSFLDSPTDYAADDPAFSTPRETRKPRT